MATLAARRRQHEADGAGSRRDLRLLQRSAVPDRGPVLTATSPRPTVPPWRPASDGDAVVARRSDAEASLTLVRGIYPTSLRLIVALKTIEASVQNAAADASRQEHGPIPPREIMRVNTMVEDGRVPISGVAIPWKSSEMAATAVS